jgi:hypothetical protein
VREQASVLFQLEKKVQKHEVSMLGWFRFASLTSINAPIRTPA